MVNNVVTTPVEMPRTGGRQKMISRKGLNAMKYLEKEKKKKQLKKDSKVACEGARRSITIDENESEEALPTSKDFKAQSVGARRCMNIENVSQKRHPQARL